MKYCTVNPEYSNVPPPPLHHTGEGQKPSICLQTLLVLGDTVAGAVGSGVGLPQGSGLFQSFPVAGRPGLGVFLKDPGQELHDLHLGDFTAGTGAPEELILRGLDVGDALVLQLITENVTVITLPFTFYYSLLGNFAGSCLPPQPLDTEVPQTQNLSLFIPTVFYPASQL